MLHLLWLRKKARKSDGTGPRPGRPARPGAEAEGSAGGRFRWRRLVRRPKLRAAFATGRRPARGRQPARARLGGLALLALALALPWWGGQLTASLLPDLTVAAVGEPEAERLLPVYAVERDDTRLALTFDATWGAEYTPALLEALDEYGVKATFFLTDIWLNAYPEQAAEIARRGHEIGLHSSSHPDFTTLTEEQMQSELQQNAELTEQLTGVRAALFRPPFGAYDDRVIRTVREQGLIPVQWSVDSLDWQDLSADDIVQRVTEKLGPGDIVLMHNNGLHTAEALPRILDYAAARGLTPVTVSGLLLPGDTYVDAGGVQHSAEHLP